MLRFVYFIHYPIFYFSSFLNIALPSQAKATVFRNVKLWNVCAILHAVHLCSPVRDLSDRKQLFKAKIQTVLQNVFQKTEVPTMVRL